MFLLVKYGLYLGEVLRIACFYCTFVNIEEIQHYLLSGCNFGFTGAGGQNGLDELLGFDLLLLGDHRID